MPISSKVSKTENLILCQLLSTAVVGGAENYAVLIANRHAENHGESHVLVMGSPGILSSRFSPKVKVHYLHFQRESIRNPLKFFHALWRGYRLLSRAVKSNGIQLLQTHLPTTNLWGLVLQLTGVCRVVVTIHNNNFLHSPDGTALGTFIKLRAYRLMVRKCPAIVAVSDRVRESLIQTLNISQSLASRVVVVPNGVPIPSRVSGCEIEAEKVRFNVPQDASWLLAAGRLTEAKNFSCLIEATGILKDDGLNFFVTIAGEGELRNDLERQVEELGLEGIVQLPGNVDNLPTLMQAADLLVMPSLWEGLPLVLLEAMASGLPVVGTRINGLQDIIQEGVEGLLCEVDDAQGLADSISRLIGDKAQLLKMGRSAESLFRERYEFERVYGDLTVIYERAMMG
jgi:glycosyltransferase involved in cell wall biosynthesis